MNELFKRIKKILGIDEELKCDTNSQDSQSIVENDTYVEPIYITPYLKESGEDQCLNSQKIEDARTVEHVYEDGKSCVNEEEIQEFIIHKDNHTDSMTSEYEDTVEDVKNNQVNVVGLLHSLADIILEYDSYILRIQDPEVKQAIELFQQRLIESLSSNGVETIKNLTKFNCMEHVTIPFSVVSDGTPIKEVKRIGFIMGNQVLLKAQVFI